MPLSRLSQAPSLSLASQSTCCVAQNKYKEAQAKQGGGAGVSHVTHMRIPSAQRLLDELGL